MAQTNRKSPYWCFTINNFVADDEAFLRDLFGTGQVHYLVFGREIADTGTPHLQGYIEFNTRRSFNQVRQLFRRAHLEPRNGSAFQAAEYCRKDLDYEEFGESPRNVPVRTGSTGLFATFVSYCSTYYDTHGSAPSERTVAREFPHLFVRYSARLMSLVDHLCPVPNIQEGELRDWQIDLNNTLQQEPDDRTVLFYVDEEGGKGKSFFYRWFYSNNESKTQLLSVGKRDDIAHAIDTTKTHFLFNIPRGGMEFVQYTIFEQLKDKVVFSPKYTSCTKILRSNTHVVVFCNEAPDRSKMSDDRYFIVNL